MAQKKMAMKSLSRRNLLKAGLTIGASSALASRAGLLLPSLLASSTDRAQAQATPPNIIFITMDDLNDFPSPFGGYAQILTPNIARLAREGVVFQRAFAAAPYCGASRSSFMTGIAPHKSGLTFQENVMDPVQEALVRQRLGIANLTSIPRFFRSLGYRMAGGGKLYHGGFGAGPESFKNFDEASWHEYYNFNWSEIANAFPGVRSYRDNRIAGQLDDPALLRYDLPSYIGSDYNTAAQEAMMPDKILAKFGSGKIRDLAANPAVRPFFLALGFYRPHEPYYVPKRFYDMYPINHVRVPKFLESLQDLADLPEFALKYLINREELPTNEDGSRADFTDLSKMPLSGGRAGDAQAVQAYLASITFADECLGQVLNELDRSGMRSNTIVVLMSDHGFHLGEKLGWRKYKLWDRSLRVPMIISAPGGMTGDCNRVVSTLDIFPTLVDLATGSVPGSVSLQAKGRSLKPLIANPAASWTSEVLSTQIVPGTTPATLAFHSLRTDRWRYIRYPVIPGATLSEELYDVSVDIGEQNNLLVSQPGVYEDVRRSLSELLGQKTG